jgi:hypothetical protein
MPTATQVQTQDEVTARVSRSEGETMKMVWVDVG